MPKKSETVYILSTCNVWKSWDSMSRQIITKDIKIVLKNLKRLIRGGDVHFDGYETRNGSIKQLEKFIKEYQLDSEKCKYPDKYIEQCISELNDKTDCVFIEIDTLAA